MADKLGEKLPKAEKAFKGWNQEYYQNTEQDIIALPPGPNVTLWNPLTASQLLEVVTSKNVCLIDPLDSKLILQIGF